MFRMLLIFGLFFTGNVLAADPDDNAERDRAYFKSLDYVRAPRSLGSHMTRAFAQRLSPSGTDE